MSRKKQAVDDAPTPYEKHLRKAMLAAEAIMGDTDSPPKPRAEALRRLARFFTDVADQMDAPKIKHEEAA
jgi:hypothetical protein